MKKTKGYIPKNLKEKKLLQAIARGLDEVKLMQEGKLPRKLALSETLCSHFSIVQET